MECLYCLSPDSKVTNSVKDGKKVLRERVCKSCHKRFYTEETRDITKQLRIKAQLCKLREFKGRKERK